MNSQTSAENQIQRNKIRLLPGIIIVVLQWISWLIIPNFVYSMAATATMVFGSLIGGLAFIIWWVFFSRAPKIDCWTALLIIIPALIIISRFSDESIKTGMGGLMFFVYAIPTLCMAFIIWAIISKTFSKRIRVTTMFLTIVLSCGFWMLIRSGGLSGNAKADFNWRWNENKNERLFTSSDNSKIISSESKNTEAEWPGFRGPSRDGIVQVKNIKTNWSSNPPVELWRWPVGAGCSSFAVRGNLFYTQEQIGEYEMVSCYYLSSGEPVWRHQDSVRFYDQHAGAGPRSTPTINGNTVYTLGATGILNALNAGNGNVLWSRNTASDTNTKDSGWGYSSSPLVVDNLIIVAATGKLIAYNKNTGEQAWIGPDGGDSYSSPHLFNINGIPQILQASGEGVKSFAPDNGKINWEHPWTSDTRIVQPALTPSGDLLINSGMKKGMRRLKVEQESNVWNINEIWTSNRIRTDFNDFVVHNNHIYGFEGPTIVCIDLENGERKWKGKRYGGQLILLDNQNLLLILTEKGEIALVEAESNEFTELAIAPAIEGKTWNHPVLIENTLLVRNAREMVAFKL